MVFVKAKALAGIQWPVAFCKVVTSSVPRSKEMRYTEPIAMIPNFVVYIPYLNTPS
jgi:hypothetical protein